MKTYHKVLSIAGSDSGGGAGIQADIKTISACGCFASTAITAITAQNTLGVKAVFPIPVESLKAQIESVLEDIGTDAIKTGMLHNSQTITEVAKLLKTYRTKNLVIDPVMVATSGNSLLQSNAIKTLKTELLPLARVITPNIPEAEILINQKIEHQSSLPDIAQTLAKTYQVSVYLKAGHATDNELTDVFYNIENHKITKLKAQRIPSKNTHGTGCTLSSAIASFLAKGNELSQAVELAKAYINEAILKGSQYSIGKGHGPVHHFHSFWE